VLLLLFSLTFLPAVAATGSMTWYFAEGFTGTGFDEYLTIQNPGAAGEAAITYYVEGQTTPTERTVPLAANSRTTVAVHNAFDATSNPGGLGRLQVGHSTRVVADVPVVVERPMYFTYNSTVRGGHNVLGANATMGGWAFGEGFTAEGFDEYLTIQNPNDIPGVAELTYFVEGQTTPTERTVSLAANSRTTVAVHNAFDATYNPGGLGRLTVGHSTAVLTTVPTVIERPMYFTYNQTIEGGHNVVGAPDMCTVNMNAAQETPPVASTASGVVRFVINPTTGEITAKWVITGLSSDITAAHIHEAAVGVPGPIRVPFSGLPADGGSFETTTTTTPSQAAAIIANPGNYYFNVHTTNFPGGEIRGQLGSSVCTP